MVLDEEALEAMLQRQQDAAAEEGRPEKARLTAKTDEFEVYERPKAAEERAAQPAVLAPEREAPRGEPQAPETLPLPPAFAQPERPREERVREDVHEERSAPTQAPLFQPLRPTAPAPQPQWAAPATVADEGTTQSAATPPAFRFAVPDQTAAPAPTGPTPTTQEARSHAPAPAPQAQPLPAGGGDGCRIALVVAQFNDEITAMMADLARKRIEKLGAALAVETTVPGVFDLPLTAQRLARRDDVDAVVVLGCVVQGETKHDEVITHAAAQQLARIACDTDTPIGFGVIGPGMTWKQAEARIVNGRHAVDAAVGQWRTLRAT